MIEQIKHTKTGARTKYFLVFCILPVTVAVITALISYFAITSYFIGKAEEHVHDVLLSQRGLHLYIQRVMHPTFYKALSEGYVRQDYYSPEILSSSFIVRSLHKFYNEERSNAGLPAIYYKMAAVNPRNPVNKADRFESDLLRKFNADRELKEYRTIQNVDGSRMLVYAIPFLVTEKRCLVCHGKRGDAPEGLQARHAGMGGFGEPVGQIRAIEIVKVPIKSEITAITITTISIFAALLSLGTLSLVAGKLRRMVFERTCNLEAEVEERKRAEQEIMQLNAELEQRVADRTAQLEGAIIDQYCLNEKLEQRTKDLEAANKNLEAFSYTISHDLRAPLRQISGYANILEEDFAAQINPQAGSLLQRVKNGCARMDNLITGILEFSRIGRQGLQKQMVDTRSIVADIVTEMNTERSGNNLEVVIGELPNCYADPLLLRQVFTNLISNAIKFSRHKETAKIEIGAGVQGDEIVFFVRDNGLGFDRQSAQRLFELFQRLHGAEIEGIGIGLATVKRIIELHGGRIWPEATPEMGATFYFTIGNQNDLLSHSE